MFKFKIIDTMNANTRTVAQAALKDQMTFRLKNVEVKASIAQPEKVSIPVVAEAQPGMVKMKDLTDQYKGCVGKHSKWIEGAVFQRFIRSYLQQTGKRLEDLIVNVPTMSNDPRIKRNLQGGMYASEEIAQRYVLYLQGVRHWDRVKDEELQISRPAASSTPEAITYTTLTEKTQQTAGNGGKTATELHPVVENDISVTLRYLVALVGAEALEEAVGVLQMCHDVVTEHLGSEPDKAAVELLKALKLTFSLAKMVKAA